MIFGHFVFLTGILAKWNAGCAVYNDKIGTYKLSSVSLIFFISAVSQFQCECPIITVAGRSPSEAFCWLSSCNPLELPAIGSSSRSLRPCHTQQVTEFAVESIRPMAMALNISGHLGVALMRALVTRRVIEQLGQNWEGQVQGDKLLLSGLLWHTQWRKNASSAKYWDLMAIWKKHVWGWIPGLVIH